MTTADVPAPEWIPDIPGVRAARHITAAAEHAAAAWLEGTDAAAAAAAAGHFQAGLCGIAACLRAMADFEPGPGPGSPPGRYTSAWEPGIYLHCASRAVRYAAADMQEAGCHVPGGVPATEAVAAGEQLAARAGEALEFLARAHGTAQARDAAVVSFMHLATVLGTAAAALASQAGDPLAAILTRQRARLEQAWICLREALAASACSADDAASLAIASQIRRRHPGMNDPVRSESGAR